MTVYSVECVVYTVVYVLVYTTVYHCSDVYSTHTRRDVFDAPCGSDVGAWIPPLSTNPTRTLSDCALLCLGDVLCTGMGFHKVKGQCDLYHQGASTCGAVNPGYLYLIRQSKVHILLISRFS